MPQEIIDVGIVVARHKLKGPWADHAWAPWAVLPVAPDLASDLAPMTKLEQIGETETFFLGRATLTFHSGETDHYRDNLSSGRPSVWIALNIGEDDRPGLILATVDPYEGEALSIGNGEILDAVDMPAEIASRLMAFFEMHHVEHPFFKRKRDRSESRRRNGDTE